MMKALVAVLMSLTLVGCAAVTGETATVGDAESPIWHGDSTFTYGERVIIEEGAAFTARHTGQPVPTFIWDGDTYATRWVVKETPSGQRLGFDGYTYNQVIQIAPYRITAAVVAHEFGHAYGLEHVGNDVRGLMNYDANELVWTEADETVCEAARLGCRM